MRNALPSIASNTGFISPGDEPKKVHFGNSGAGLQLHGLVAFALQALHQLFCAWSTDECVAGAFYEPPWLLRAPALYRRPRAPRRCKSPSPRAQFSKSWLHAMARCPLRVKSDICSAKGHVRFTPIADIAAHKPMSALCMSLHKQTTPTQIRNLAVFIMLS
jgi:hypothetical protein